MNGRPDNPLDHLADGAPYMKHSDGQVFVLGYSMFAKPGSDQPSSVELLILYSLSRHIRPISNSITALYFVFLSELVSGGFPLRIKGGGASTGPDCPPLPAAKTSLLAVAPVEAGAPEATT